LDEGKKALKGALAKKPGGLSGAIADGEQWPGTQDGGCFRYDDATETTSTRPKISSPDLPPR